MVAGNTYGWRSVSQRQTNQSTPRRAILHLLAGANDYRTVDLPDTDETGTWLGVFKSFDSGQRWQMGTAWLSGS
jgi:hypothetical protein